MARATYSEETKARVLAGIATGARVADLAREHGVKPGTIRQWKNRTDDPAVTAVTQIQQGDGANFGRLLAAYISETLTTLAAQAREFRDPTWLKAQSAADAASLHGVLADRAFRVLAALIPDPDDGPESLDHAIDGTARTLSG